MRCSRILLLSCLATVGCSDKETVRALESEVAALQSEITTLQEQVERPPDPTPDPSAVRREITLDPPVAGAAANSPRGTNTTAEGRRENRRVEVVIVE